MLREGLDSEYSRHLLTAAKELPRGVFLQRGTDAARQGHPLCA